MEWRPRVLLLLAAVCALAAAGRAQTPTPPSTSLSTFAIAGTVRFALSNQPAEGVRVELVLFSGEVVTFHYTRSSGDFEFARLGRGSYYVVVAHPGFESIREHYEISGHSYRGISLYLTPIKSGSQSQPGAIISLHEMALPRKAREAFEKGWEQKYRKKDLRGSLQHFQKAIAAAPSYYRAHYEAGLLHQQAGQAAEAEAAFRKAIETSEGTYAGAFVALAGLLCDLEKYADAEAPARKGVELDPADPRGHYELARALFGLGRLDDSEKSLAEAIQKRPEYGDLYLLAANIHMRRQDFPALLQALNKYLEVAPDGPASASVREMKAAVEQRLAQAKSPPPKQERER